MTNPGLTEKDPVNILLVDDRPDGLLALEAVLRSPQYILFQASSGIEAIAIAQKHIDFAVILLDVQMPGLDGFQTAARLREIDGSKDAQIIFVTAINTDSSHVHRGYDFGAVDYLFKPFDPHILQSKVAILASIFQKNRQIQHQSALLLEAEQRERIRELAQVELENFRRYRNLTDAIPHIVWKTDPRGAAEHFNKIWSDYTGFTNEQSRIDGWKSAFHAKDLDRLLEIWNESMTTGRNFETEARIISGHDAAERWHLVRGVAERDDEGDVSGWIITCTDIQSRKEAEELMDRSNKELEQFAFAASHDLQEPLRKIISFGDLLREHASGISERAASHLDRIQDAARRMSELVNNLLRYSRVSTMERSFEQVDLKEVVDEVLSNLELQLRSSDGRVEVGDLPTIVTNRIWMQQLIQNLVGNALKFRGDAPPLIKISATKRDKEWLFSVQDNGIGIEPEFQQEVFGIFRRLHSRDKYPGTGIGLAIVKKIVEGQGGNVWVESEIGRGSTFFFTLPLLPLPQEIEELTVI